ncbi:Protein cms1 [Savitreella phatthalungensis]
MSKRKAAQSVDALVDDFDLGSDSLSISDAGDAVSVADSGSEFAVDDDSSLAGDTLARGSRQSNGVKSLDKQKLQLTAEQKRARRKAQKDKSKRRRAAQEGVDSECISAEESVGLSGIATLDPAGQADALARLMKQGLPTLSTVELEDIRVRESFLIDTSSFTGTRSLDRICEFIEQYTEREDVSSANKAPGTPHTLVISSSALRVADVVRKLRPKYKTAKTEVAKLFGKEKLADQATFLQKYRTGIAAGVPGRVRQLLEEGSLKSSHLERLILDASHQDSKKRTLLTLKDLAPDLAKLLSKDDLRDRLATSKLKLVLY